MIKGYEVVEQLSDNYSLVKDESQNYCYGIYEHSSNSIIGYNYYKIKRLSKDFLVGKEKDGSNTDLLTITGTVVDHVSFGSYDFLGKFRGLSIIVKKVKRVNDKKILLLETYKDRVSGDMYTYKATYVNENEQLKYNGIDVYPSANRFTEAFKNRLGVLKAKARNKLMSKSK